MVDFQFDLFPDGSPAEVFSLDVMLNAKPRDAMKAAFLTGEYAALGRQLKNRKIADSRLETALDMTFTKQIPVGSTDGGTGRYLLLLIPQWIKIRWIRGVIQPAKLCCFAKAG